jgi:zinc D-Ala-D-Ala carboxypeptidase
MSTLLSENFTLEELIFSENARRLNIDNSPTPELLEHAKLYLVPGLEKIRALIKSPIKVTSGYRSPALNRVTPGSASNSQHSKFEAADIVSPKFGSVVDLAKIIIDSKKINFDQLIYEYDSWVHISFSDRNRGEILTKRSNERYKVGIILKNGTRIL